MCYENQLFLTQQMATLENTKGRLGYLTPEQTETLEQFRKELATEGFYDKDKHSDHHLLRFLRARQFQLPAAKEMWINCEKWRVEFGTNTVFRSNQILHDFDFPEYAKVRKAYPRIYHKTDKIGRPIYIERLGIANIKELWEVTTAERMLKNHVYEVFWFDLV